MPPFPRGLKMFYKKDGCLFNSLERVNVINDEEMAITQICLVILGKQAGLAIGLRCKRPNSHQ